MTDRTFRAISVRRCWLRPRLPSPALAQTDSAGTNRRAIAGARTPTRPTSPATADRARSRRTARSPTDRDHHHRDQSARRISRTFRSASRRSARAGSTSSTSRTSRNIPSSCRRSASRPSQPGSTTVYMRGVATGGDGNHTGLAALGRLLSRRAAGDDDRRNARRPHLRHRPDREPRRPAGHALRRVERGRHDPHHHQQARAGRHRRAGSTARSTRSRTAAWAASLEGMINLPIADNIAFRGSRLLPARRRLHRQCLRRANLLRHDDLRTRSRGPREEIAVGCV